MLATVQSDHQAMLHADEVDDVGAMRFLPFELQAEEAMGGGKHHNRSSAGVWVERMDLA